MKKILGLLIALAIGIPAYASITVSPTRIEINANKKRSSFFEFLSPFIMKHDKKYHFLTY